MNKILLSTLSFGMLALRAGSAPVDSLVLTNRPDMTNRISLSARFGLNISVRFKGVTGLSVAAPNRRTPDGDLYNYDDGYVLTDSSGNEGGVTWNWGYDNTDRQLSGNSILMSRSSLASSTSPSSTLDDNPAFGGELLYQRVIGHTDQMRFGLELAGNYLNVSLSGSSSAAVNVSRVRTPFAFTPGTQPPEATPSDPYQGTFDGGNFVISNTPGASISEPVAGGGRVSGHHEFDADVWGFRFGPFLEQFLGQRVTVGLSGGLAGGYVDGRASWRETASIGGISGPTLSHSGQHGEMLWGFYVGGSAGWRFAERWTFSVGAQYQYLSNYEGAFGGRKVELDMRSAVMVTAGVGFDF